MNKWNQAILPRPDLQKGIHSDEKKNNNKKEEIWTDMLIGSCGSPSLEDYFIKTYNEILSSFMALLLTFCLNSVLSTVSFVFFPIAIA